VKDATTGINKFSKKILGAHLKILGNRRVKRSKFQIEDPEILGATV